MIYYNKSKAAAAAFCLSVCTDCVKGDTLVSERLKEVIVRSRIDSDSIQKISKNEEYSQNYVSIFIRFSVVLNWCVYLPIGLYSILNPASVP